LDNKVFDIIDARCNHEVSLNVRTYRPHCPLIFRAYWTLQFY